MMFLIRHGETIWNREGRIQGHKDSPLTLKGIAQARTVGGILKTAIERRTGGRAGLRMIASPLGRAYQTAVIVAEAAGLDPVAVEPSAAVKEHTWGEWDGLRPDEIAARDPARWRERQADKWRIAPPGGESYAVSAARMRPWLEEFGGDADLIVVSHGAIGRIMRGGYLGLKPAETLQLQEPQDQVFEFVDGKIIELCQ